MALAPLNAPFKSLGNICNLCDRSGQELQGSAWGLSLSLPLSLPFVANSLKAVYQGLLQQIERSLLFRGLFPLPQAPPPHTLENILSWWHSEIPQEEKKMYDARRQSQKGGFEGKRPCIS